MGGFGGALANPGDLILKGTGQLMQDRQFAAKLALEQANAESERALQQAQTTQTQLQNTQTQMDQADQQAIRDAMRANPDAIMKGDYSTLEGKVQPKSLIGLQNMVLDHQTKLLNLSKEQSADRLNALGEVADTVTGLQSLAGKNEDGTEDLSRVNAELPNAINRLQKSGAWQRAGINMQPPTNITSVKQLEDWEAGVGIEHAAQNAALDTQKKAGEVSAKAAEAAKTGLETQVMQHQLDLYNTLKKTPQALADRVAGSIDPTKYPEEYKRALNEAQNAPDLKGINEAISKHAQNVSEQEKSIAVESNPTVLAARRDSAIAQAKALREGDNPALAGVPPAAAQTAVTAATKLDQDYIKAREATEAMGKLLDLADKGNVAAGANIPMVGVAAANAINGIKRINSAEIAQYGTAGSLLQKIQGKLQGWTEGEPIPATVRDDIRELHQQLGENSYRQYTSGLDSLNKRTGAKFGPTQEAPNIRRAPTVRFVSNGTTYNIPAGQVEAFKKDHPNAEQK